MAPSKSSSTFKLKENYVQDLSAWSLRLMTVFPSCRLNFAYRQALGFVMTRIIAGPSDLKEDLIYVEKWDLETGNVAAASAENLPGVSGLHQAAFQNRSSVIFSLWIEDADLVQKAMKKNIPVLKSAEKDFFSKSEKYLGMGNMLVIDGLGVLSLGCTVDDAGQGLVGLVDS
jgi:hypothetical protein